MKIPDHFIREVRDALAGKKKSANRQPQHLRRVYREQADVGRRNFVRGRLIKSWGQTKPPSEGRMTTEEWVKRLSEHVLRTLLRKWETRCKIVAESTNTLERRQLIEEAEELWNRRSALPLLTQDRYLFEDSNKPNSECSAKEIRNWIMTRKLAVDAAKETQSKGNTSLLEWLITE